MSKYLLFLFKKEKTNYFYTRLYIVNSITYNIEDLNYYLFFIKGIKHKKERIFLSMRKEMKSKSRRKWLLGGSLAFASVALLTTGFATWVISVSAKTKNTDTNVNVDTVRNESIVLTYTLDEKDKSIYLGENVAVTDGNLQYNINKEENKAADFQITLKDVKVTWGKDFSQEVKSLDFSLPETYKSDELPQTDVTSLNFVGREKDKIGRNNWTEGNKTYVDLAENQNQAFPGNDSENVKLDGNAYVWDIGNITLNFRWGSFFDNAATLTAFYNKKISAETDVNKQSEIAVKAGQEIDEMHQSLNEKTIRVLAEVKTGAKTSTSGD